MPTDQTLLSWYAWSGMTPDVGRCGVPWSIGIHTNR